MQTSRFFLFLGALGTRTKPKIMQIAEKISQCNRALTFETLHFQALRDKLLRKFYSVTGPQI